MSQKVYDVKHVLLELQEHTDWEEEYTTYFVEIAPFGRVNLLIKDTTLAQLVHEQGCEEDRHRHYGKIQFDCLSI